MQVLDQQVAATRPVAQQRPHVVEGDEVDLPAFRGPRRTAAAGAVLRRDDGRIHLKNLVFFGTRLK
jgi:hypothetical protein